jgi:serine/threonine protein kinase
MEPDRWRQVEQLYHVALQKKPDKRAAFLEQACAGNASLREEVESLLSFAGDADTCLQAAVREVASEASGVSATETRQSGATTGALGKLGRYQLLEKIGQGGMGVVYRAMDPAIGRMVAIKTILWNDSGGEHSELTARLVRESQAGGRLSHPNIVAVHDVCHEGKTSYIVMEYVHGRTLDKIVREDPSLRSSGEALRIVQQCAAALDYAHSKGVVHRDVKPANIMLQSDGLVKIADFGIAKVSQFSGLTQSAVTVGSPEYMAPEQWRGEAVTAQTDQYALATVAYVLLTGRRPFEADSVGSMAAMTLFQEPPAAVTFNSRLSPEIDKVLRKALSKTGGARYLTCSEFAGALQRAWQSVPAPAPAPVAPRAVNLQKWIVAALITALIAALSAAGWLFYQRNAGGHAKTPVQAAAAASPPQIETKPPAPTQQSQSLVATPREKAGRPLARPADPPPEVDPERRGVALLKHSDYAEAVNYFTKAIATKPDYRSYFYRASAYQRLGQTEKAIADYSKAIRLKPYDASAYHDRAVCEMRLDLVDDAIVDYDRALELEPGNPRAWNGRGAIYLKKGGYQKAIKYFTKAIELDPNFVQAYENRAAAEKKLKDTAAAEKDMKMATALKQQKTGQ